MDAASPNLTLNLSTLHDLSQPPDPFTPGLPLWNHLAAQGPVSRVKESGAGANETACQVYSLQVFGRQQNSNAGCSQQPGSGHQSSFPQAAGQPTAG